jgi:protein TonB
MIGAAMILPSVFNRVRIALLPYQGGITDTVTVIDMIDKEELKETTPVQLPETEPPVLIKETLQFAAPIMTDASQITDENELSTMDKLSKSDAQISNVTFHGSKDLNAIDPADLAKQEVIAEVVDDKTPFTSVEQMPEFKGGIKEMFKFISNNLRYPALAAQMGMEGTATIRFVVDKLGSVTDVELLRGFDKSCDAEAMRVIKSMPKWQAGRQNGMAVNVYYIIPIRFKLDKQ